MLPPELLAMVCSHLPKPDLKNVRLVCQNFNRATIPFLFDKVYISFDIADLRIAKNPISHFDKHVTTLVFTSVYYMDLDEEEFCHGFAGREGSELWHEAEFEHAEHAFRLYEETRDTQLKTFLSGTCQAHLSNALCRLSNLRRIVLTDLSGSREKSSLEGSKVGSCTYDGCTSNCLERFEFATQGGLETEGAWNPWQTVLLALSATNSSVSEIMMEYDHEDMLQGGLNTCAFELLPPELEDAKIRMQNLVKLRLDLHVAPDKFVSNGQTDYVHRNVPELLRAAVNLECLALEAYDHNDAPVGATSPLQVMLGKCVFAKLRSLILAYFGSTEAELLRLVKHSPGLKQLTLECHDLTSGSWARTATEVRKALPLKHVQFNQLYEGSPASETKHEYMDYFGGVEDFFLRNGTNPFTKEAIERYEADLESGRTRNLETQTPFERYHMFH